MKIIYFLLFFFVSLKISAQKVYYTTFKADADLVVFITKNKSDADFIVKKVQYNNEVKPGFWKEVIQKRDADLIVYISRQNITNIKKVYFTKFGDEVKTLILPY
ncbi:DUF6150 family protein [Epilithonimonas sp.]|uniref:DUF6150 family protein n=1 Tax=Epilithonimonas sp. TaxID=2894511 RepID=UPI002898008D|nr:DUF6150 family protein [Epilithonimonas sp.]